MAKENIEDKVNAIKDMGYNVYSISKLNTYNDCQYGYWRSYVLHDRGAQNVYADLGGKLHDHLQNICDGVESVEDMKNSFDMDLFNSTLFMSFPSAKVQDSWESDMKDFVNTFQPLKYDNILTEKGFVVNLDGVWVQGFIDVLAYDKDDLIILDWKTSSEFKKDKLKHAGRQLIIYQLAMEQELGITAKQVGWYMLKYVNVYFDGKVKMCNRGSWVKDRSGVISTQLKKLGYSSDDIDDLIGVAISNNNLDNMPQDVQDRFTTEPCIVWYDVTEELIQETKDYIRNTVSEIECKNHSDSKLWKCKNIYGDKGFFCQNLCGHTENCKLYQWYKENK